MRNPATILSFLSLVFFCFGGLQASPVLPHNYSNAWSVGFILGKPIRGEYRGLIFKTYELNIVTGSFSDNPLFSGNVHPVSTRDPVVFQQFQQLNESENYVFSFWRPRLTRPYIADTFQFISSFQSALKPQDFHKSNLPTSLKVEEGPEGKFVPRGYSTKKGRIIQVERWTSVMTGRPLCAFTLDMGGTRKNPERPIENEEIFNIYSEEGCRFVERILPYGLPVEIHYSQAYATWDYYGRIAHEIAIVRGGIADLGVSSK